MSWNEWDQKQKQLLLAAMFFVEVTEVYHDVMLSKS